ncbi:MAG: AMP-binding protein, partial [Planctomycetaceae bacterium]
MTISDANIAGRLAAAASRWPQQPAVIAPAGRKADGRALYSRWTFAELEQEVELLTAGLRQFGVQQGHKLVLFVPFSREFIALTFALMRTGATLVLIDPGMGRTNIFDCLKEVDPDGFIAIPMVHAVRLWKRRLFPHAKLNVTVGRRWLWGGATYHSLKKLGATGGNLAPLPPSSATDRAAIIFTSGSTGPPKGVVYEHGMFDAQVDFIQSHYGIEAGDVDLPGFPLFGLFNAAMGVTTV